jgi:hypothetical protein
MKGNARTGSRALAEFPLPRFRVECQRCGRAGSYRLAGLIERFGAGAVGSASGELRRAVRRQARRSRGVRP